MHIIQLKELVEKPTTVANWLLQDIFDAAINGESSKDS